MSLDTGMASFGFAIGVTAMMATNAIAKIPTFKKPWQHLAAGAAFAYVLGSIPRTEKYLMELTAKQGKAWDRRQAKNDAIYSQFQSRLQEAEALMKEDVTLLGHKDSHSGHELKFYKKY